MNQISNILQNNGYSSDIIINNQSKDCIIIFHGFNATPYEMHELAEAIGTLDVDVYVPLLPKHGISSSELSELVLEEVLQWGRQYIQEKKKEYERIIIIGHSMGSGMAYSIAASNIPVDGIILTGLSRNFTLKIRLITWLAKVFKFKYIPGIFGKLEKSISKDYIKWKKEKIPKQPILLMREVVESIPNKFDTLSNISSPFMIVIGTKDFITHANYVDNFLIQTKSKRKIAYILNNGTHDIFLSDFRYNVISKILNFIIEILSDQKVKEEDKIGCYVLEKDKITNKTKNLLRLMNSKKSLKYLHSKECLP